MNSIGETLRRERLRLNLDLEHVARETKINLKLLEAIEAEDFSRLPGGVFTKSFVRQYARLLGLDEDEIASELQRSIQPMETVREMPPPPVEPDVPRVPDWPAAGARRGSSLPALAGVVVVMLLCSGIYALWQRSSRPAAVAEAPLAARVPEPAAPSAAVNPAVAVTALDSQPVTPQAAADALAAANIAERSGDASAPVRVGLTASEPTWISVRSDSKFVFSGTLQPNETKELDGTDTVRIVFGRSKSVV